MNPVTVKVANWLPSLALVGLILWLARLQQPVLAVALVLVVEGYAAWRTAGRSWAGQVAASQRWLLSLSMAVLIVLSPGFGGQAVLAAAFLAGRVWLVPRRGEERSGLILAAVNQLAALSAIFLAAGVWRVPTGLVVILTWATSWLVATGLLARYRDPAAPALAAAWALVAAQCAWVFSLWLVNYIVLDGLLVVPQPAVVLTAIAYCLAGIYVSHRQGSLSRSRLVEYLMIGLVVLVVVALGTKWNGLI
ncbi:hypothetical protein KY386_00505 [Candidatus Parcubacteria bacterium]|nr:hypothetical protein [Candidatus Parcubacteria bacterium]